MRLRLIGSNGIREAAARRAFLARTLERTRTAPSTTATPSVRPMPSLEVWRNPGKRTWWEPFEQKRIEVDDEDPLVLQIRQFCMVIRGDEPPLVRGREGLKTLGVVDAVKRSAATGERIELN